MYKTQQIRALVATKFHTLPDPVVGINGQAKVWLPDKRRFSPLSGPARNGIRYTVLRQSSIVTDLVAPSHVGQYCIQGKSEKDEYCGRTRQFIRWTECQLPN